MQGRRWLYYKGIKKSTRFSVPVIIVGNITVGGTGKTPLVIALARFLLEQGYKPGIVSRGYGGKAAHYPLAVTPTSSVMETGDEAILLARNTPCPVIVDPCRVRAVTALLEKTDCNIVISDDGLQHYALARDIEIVVIDGERRFGNSFCLPAGPLREALTRLHKVDFKVTNGMARSGEYAMKLRHSIFRQVSAPQCSQDVTALQNKTLHAVAGIGNPTRFFNLLRSLGLSIIEHAFPDHYLFKQADFPHDAAFIIMTEKDAVKCEAFADERYWYLPVEAELEALFWQNFYNKIK
jgi:tetraacyldisaccharide 4'-kinase